ncbi:hypothetical protein [Streptomyces tsukubensis]|uniref:Secreted protein n=1 Tax=Streptomyces tsukubensis TaxID=83656 RepID=A0A1V4AAL6_9ACTN|nr:hypothetical protein [Streptomyces tsukubensis]OON80870.1 hypothetical protein B1H18_10830 [Streptomyces tsukubensis]QFR93489.1 hypothetical protein GBW32_10835 [Streptomyces tsukubensis]
MKPPVGSYVVDVASGRVGKVLGHEGAYVQLVPIGGGRAWECAPGALRRATAGERIRAANSRVNARSRGEVL